MYCRVFYETQYRMKSMLKLAIAFPCLLLGSILRHIILLVPSLSAATPSASPSDWRRLRFGPRCWLCALYKCKCCIVLQWASISQTLVVTRVRKPLYVTPLPPGVRWLWMKEGWRHLVSDFSQLTFEFPSVFWRWWLGDRKGMWPKKNLCHLPHFFLSE